MFRAQKQATDEELALFGFTREDGADDADQVVEVWPDNWAAVMLFIDLMTQWRMGMAGAVGLDYTAIPIVMDLRSIPDAERSALFSDIRVMESAALEAMRSKQ